MCIRDSRLGANEAPPAILSIFLGKQLSSILDEIARQISSSKMTAEEKTTLKLGIGRIPEILLDTTDRNRTSPFLSLIHIYLQLRIVTEFTHRNDTV